MRALLLLLALMSPALAQGWVDKLTSGHGLCCSNSDGQRIQFTDWRRVEARDHQYEVNFRGEWVHVPPSAEVSSRNQDGIARVWTVSQQGEEYIRCFLPGVEG